MLLVEVTSESPTNEAETAASTPTEDNPSSRIVFENQKELCIDPKFAKTSRNSGSREFTKSTVSEQSFSYTNDYSLSIGTSGDAIEINTANKQTSGKYENESYEDPTFAKTSRSTESRDFTEPEVADQSFCFTEDLNCLSIDPSGGATDTNADEEQLSETDESETYRVHRRRMTCKSDWLAAKKEQYDAAYVVLMDKERRSREQDIEKIRLKRRNETGEYDQSQEDEDNLPNRRSETGYIGLINQAMTCYLNSLLQALYMTPEFRNALYNWEYVHDSDKDQAKSIPYQLQKLFLNLQTSSKNAVETTSLTKSFGWDSTEAWQQHDIQELCRVMFEALEQKFKNTDQADLINRLYEGKMIDYVKCLECGKEKSREDTFLDIPLPVRPFGSNVAYNSIEEALHAFVQPETLDGTNQYHCETCNKKCDAHKGLKFKTFPYFLTLHLKRFDFDYNTFHRIKLNDEVTFPDTLNLNSFIPSSTTENAVSTEESSGNGEVNVDDSSTMDSGKGDDDSQTYKNGKIDEKCLDIENHEEDEDEGIERSNGPSTSGCNSVNHDIAHGPPGPYMYELFSIMIHSGSASGGHYYAYIKDFRTGKWFCFNDQNVTPITHDDIQKTYGGGPARAYYSGVYSSSSNAYMLMYRQIDPERNVLPMQVADFPKHLQALLMKMQESEDARRLDCEFTRHDGENSRRRDGKSRSRRHDDKDEKHVEMWMLTRKLVVHCHHPVKKTCVSEKLLCMPEETWADFTQQAYKAFRLEGVVDRDQVRLVTYDSSTGTPENSFEDRENEGVGTLLRTQPDFLLEIRGKDETFKPYPPESVAKKIYVLDVAKKKIVKGPITFRGRLTQTLREYKEELSPVIGIPVEDIYLIPSWTHIPPYCVIKNHSTLQKEEFEKATRIFVPTGLLADLKKCGQDIEGMLDMISHLITLNVQLRTWSKEELESIGVPNLEEKKLADASPATNKPQKLSPASETPKEVEKVKNNETTKMNDAEEVLGIGSKTTSPPVHTEEDWHTPEQSNSEDSSLTFSYSDRTLVGDGDVSEDDEYPLPLTDHEFSNQNNQENGQVEDTNEYLFHASRDEYEPDKLVRVLVDRRMSLCTLKKLLEPHVGIPAEYYRVSCQPAGDFECTSAEASFHEDGTTLRIKPGLALRNDEFKVFLYQLCLDSEFEPFKFLCELTISKDSTIGQIKKKILTDLRRKFDIDIPIKRCRIRRKIFKTAGNVLLDDKKADRSHWPREIIVQQLPDKETVTKQTDVVVFCRRVSPPGISIGPIQEIVLHEKTVTELNEKISKLSGIPLGFLGVGIGKRSLPDNGMLLIRNKFIDFDRHPGNEEYHPLCVEDGTVIYYRDNRENIEDVDNTYKTEGTDGWHQFCRRTERTYSTRTSRFSPRRERALKIHVDDM